LELTVARPEQGSVALLEDPAAQQLLRSTEVAHLAYTWTDGTPRCTPIWFHWNGTEIVMSGPPNAPKVLALDSGAPVAVTIDSADWPYSVLLVRGRVEVDDVDGVAPEYRDAAKRYFGPEQGSAWCDQFPDETRMTRFRLTPEWVGVLDFDGMRRLPSALAS
jgi:hypothetical protein